MEFALAFAALLVLVVALLLMRRRKQQQQAEKAPAKPVKPFAAVKSDRLNITPVMRLMKPHIKSFWSGKHRFCR